MNVPELIEKRYCTKGEGRHIDMGDYRIKIMVGKEAHFYKDSLTHTWHLVGDKGGTVFLIALKTIGNVGVVMESNGKWDITYSCCEGIDNISTDTDPKNVFRRKIHGTWFMLSKVGKPLKQPGWGLDEIFQRHKRKRSDSDEGEDSSSESDSQ
jgi:hypothetical protein